MAETLSLIGQPQVRLDGRDKVTGRALYAADEPVANPAHAVLVTSTIARGLITAMDLKAARAIPGVLDILTHDNVGLEVKTAAPQAGGHNATTLEGHRVWHDGQIIAVVVADSYEAAVEAAHKVRVTYDEHEPSATFGSPGTHTERREPGEHKDFDVGDVTAGLAAADVVIDQRYGTPTQHHNPIELYSTTCAWANTKLTVWEPSQFVYGLRGSLAGQLGIEPDDIRVVSKFVGGAFGSKGAITARTAWIAVAARRIGRPVKLVATRDQGFTIVTYRAETQHHIQLGATRDGRLTALRHEGWELTSRPSWYNVSGTETTARMYACPNIQTRVNVVHADRNTPGFMRAPPDTPYMFPLEVAMDELATALGIDPVELRRRNDTAIDPATGHRFSTRQLVACLDQAAERFGWSGRNPAPGSMRDGDWLVGWGCASAAYPSNIAAAAARVTLRPNGHAKVELAAHDIGTGALTICAMMAADRLGLEVAHVSVAIGDTVLPPAALAAGSSHTASIAHAIDSACQDLRQRIARAATTSNEGPLAGRDPATLRFAQGSLHAPDGASEPLPDAVRRLTPGALEVYAEHVPAGSPPDAMAKVYAGKPPLVRGNQRQDVTAYAFGAQFVEVRVHRRTGEIRVPRMVGAFASGTIINPLTAHSQYMGGMIWGLGAALHEKTEIDPVAARYVNDNLSEYHIPVNADVRRVEVIMVPEEDTAVNPLGIKGIGEIGIVGVNAAISNAVFHATGRRIRQLPIRIEDVL